MNLISSTGASTHGSNASTHAPKKELDKDDFLKLFITRLRYQNPLEPVNDEQFIAQMAQFTSLEQMQNMNQELQAVNYGVQALADLQVQMGHLSVFGQAISMLGKEVLLNSGERGIVQRVINENGLPQLVVGDRQYRLDQISEVLQPEVATDE